MRKRELVTAICQDTFYTRKVVERVLESFIGNVERVLEDGDKVVLSGFGTFRVRRFSARKSVNPQTKEGIIVPEKYKPVFDAGVNFKRIISDKFSDKYREGF